MEYYDAKKKYTATRSRSRCADGKENNHGESRPPIKKESAKASTSLATKTAKQHLRLPSDYNTAKLQYMASKSRANSTTTRESGESAGKVRKANDASRSTASSNPTSSDA